CFFFQAEDGIRDFHVTGVQTCALPISSLREVSSAILRSDSTVSAGTSSRLRNEGENAATWVATSRATPAPAASVATMTPTCGGRSEERRVGKESGAGWSPGEQQ